MIQPKIKGRRPRALYFAGRALTFAVFTLLFGFHAFAQQDLATLTGTITDATGAVVAGATVTVRSAALAVERTATTSDEGTYTVPQLRPGVYSVTVAQTGFSEAAANEVEIGVGQNRTLDFSLTAGGGTEVVNVTGGDAVTIDTGSARLGANVTAREVGELPVNGRNVSQLYLLAPGAVNTGTGNFDNIRFNGRANQQNQTRLDGIEATAIFDSSPGYLTVQGSQFRLQTSLENIQEFRVDSSNYPAEYGTGTGGQINVVGKSGSNDFNGSLFYFLRNDALDARNFFDTNRKSPLRLNQFGGSLGGRIVKDRLFFFGSYEGLRQRAGFNIIELTLSDYAREFVQSGGTARLSELGLAPGTGDITRIEALRATNIINAFPVGSGQRLALGGVANGAQFIQVNRNAELDENAYSFRLDGRLDEAGRFNLFTRYQRTTGDLISPDGATGRLLSATQAPDNFVTSLQQVYGATVFNETKIGFNRAPTDLRTIVPAVNSPLDISTIGINLSGSIVQPGVNGGAATGIASPGGLTRQSSAGNGRAQPIRGRTFTLLDNLAVTRGNHTLKFGGEFRNIFVDFDQLGGTTYSYDNLSAFLLNSNPRAAFIGDLSVPGDFRVRTPTTTTISRPVGGLSRARQYYLIGYAQDQWNIRPNFTVNYGLRYEYYSPVRERDNRAALFDAASGRLLDPATTDFYRANKTNFGPRLAFTYAPARFNNRTVFRVGGGLYYGPGQFEDLIQPIESNVFRNTSTLATGLTVNSPAQVADTTNPVQFTPRAYDVNGYRVPERVAQYGASIQQQLPGDTVLTVAYVGSQGRNLFQRNITNRILPGQTTIGFNAAIPAGVGVINETDANGRVVRVRTVREFDIVSGNTLTQPFGEIDYKTSGGRDNFNAMQVTINRRFTGGLTLGGHYQWGHSIGTTQGSNEANTAQNPFDFNQERGNNTFDVRHSANVSALYELPIGEDRLLNLGGVGNSIFRGLQIGGIYNGRSGLPIDVRITRADVVIQNPTTGEVRALPSAISATSQLPAGFIAVVNTPGGSASRNTRRPDLVAGVNPYINDGGLLFLNPAAFAIPRPGTYGNLSRNALYGPTFHQFDLTLQKRFAFTENTNVEFRTEVYNLFNKANFANPPVTLNVAPGTTVANPDGTVRRLQPGEPIPTSITGNFGQINSTVGRTVGLGTNRQIQFSLRLNF